jgi:hypothetical protein
MTGRRDYLLETAGLLWPGEGRVGVGRSGPYVLVPSGSAPRLLVPAGGRAGAAAVRGYGGHGSRTAWLRARVLASGFATGAARLAFRDRLAIGPGEPGLDAHLSELLGREVLLALHIGPPRANRKPVLQLLTPAGETVGFAKLGVNDLTRRLVFAEAAALRSVAAADVPGVEVPGVLHAGEWRGLGVLVQSPLPVQRSHPTPAPRRLAAMIAVAGTGTSQTYDPDALRTRVAALPPGAPVVELAAALEQAVDGPALPSGAWHGDWTPWNTAFVADRVLIWDWERYDPAVPLGFDALHHFVQAAVAGAGARRPEHATSLLAAAPELLAPFGVDAAAARRAAVLYLVEIAARYLADDQVAAGGAAGRIETWLLPALTGTR